MSPRAKDLSDQFLTSESVSHLISSPGRRHVGVPKFHTIAQVAEVVGVSIRTVRRWIDAGDLAKHEFGRTVRIAETDLRAFLAQHRNG